jgi:hypothetical protein
MPWQAVARRLRAFSIHNRVDEINYLLLLNVIWQKQQDGWARYEYIHRNKTERQLAIEIPKCIAKNIKSKNLLV